MNSSCYISGKTKVTGFVMLPSGDISTGAVVVQDRKCQGNGRETEGGKTTKIRGERFLENTRPQRTQEKRLVSTHCRRINDQDISFQIEIEFGRLRQGIHLPSATILIRCVQDWLGEL